MKNVKSLKKFFTKIENHNFIIKKKMINFAIKKT